MEQQTPLENNNIIELNEENEDKNKQQKINQTPTRHLRDIKKVNYSKFFSEDPDNSEDYEPEEKSQKVEITKKRQRPKSVTKAATNATKKKKEEENNPENKMDVEPENDEKKNKNSNGYGYIINIDETLAKYSTNNNDNANNNNPNNINIPNSDLILIILELCLNSSQFGIEKDNSSRLFWEEVGKIEKLKPITSKFKTETLRKYWRTIREAKKYKKIISETKRYANELNNNNLKLLSSIRVISEYVSSPSKRKFEYFLNKHVIKPASKPKKINANDMTPSEQIEDVINTFIKCFPKKKEKEIIDALLQTSFDIENAFLVLKDKENLGFFTFSEKDDEIVAKNFEDNDDKNEEYQELINVKGLEDVIRRKEFLFNVKIDRSQYNKVEEEENNNNNLEVDDDKNKDKNNEENKEENKDKDKREIKGEENKDKEKIDENKDDKEKDKEKEKDINKEEKGTNIS
jgi:hypothetical protein